MTKVRPPLTIDAALTRIAEQIPGGWAAMAEITGRRMGLVRSWGDPDRREQVPLRDAILLDQAYRESGGTGAPLFAYYHSRLDAAGALAPSNTAALLAIASEVVRECSDAETALIDAAREGAGPAQFAVARKEIEEAIAVLQRALPMMMGPAAYADFVGRQSATH